MKVRFDLNTSVSRRAAVLERLQELLDSGRVPTFAVAERLIQHEDEEIAAQFAATPKWGWPMFAWALWDRAVTDAEREREAWNPLLDCAAHLVLTSGKGMPPARSPHGYPSPEERAQLLTSWAGSAAGQDIDRALATFTSGAAHRAILSGARDVTRAMVEQWLSDRRPMVAMARNPVIARDPELVEPLASHAYWRIMDSSDDGGIGALTLRTLLDGGWTLDAEMRDGLMSNLDDWALLEPKEDGLRCYPAAEVMAHPAVKLGVDEWEQFIGTVSMGAVDAIWSALAREDAPEWAVKRLIARLELTNGAGSVDGLIEMLAEHPTLESDEELRRWFLGPLPFSVQLKMAHTLTPDEFWGHISQIQSERGSDPVALWLERATPGQLAAVTPEQLASLLICDSPKVRLIAQTMVGQLQRESPVADIALAALSGKGAVPSKARAR